MSQPSHKLSVAPMMERTDRHCRYLLRLLAPNALLYTEMVTATALLRGDAGKLLRYDPSEHPVALQLGGAEPATLAAAAGLGESMGYDEINLNIGCPSDRVQAGCFGAALMERPELVADCVAAISDSVAAPVTVKTRLGIDDKESYEFLQRFVEHVAAAGCATFIIHARKALLNGLSPKQNREIPPLDYARVYRLKADYPALKIVINGGFSDEQSIMQQLNHVDGVMLGRQAYQNPFLLARLDRLIFRDAPLPSRDEILERYIPYLDSELAAGTPLRLMTRHLMGLFAAQPGGKRWRRFLGELPHGREGLNKLQARL